MAITEREKHISRLDAMAKCLEDCIDPTVECKDCDTCDLTYGKGNMGEMLETIKYAISSLKTDLKYDLMYEGEEVYTKADMVVMLGEIQAQISDLWDNDPSYIEGVHDSEMIIQQKIEQLKGAKNENNSIT